MFQDNEADPNLVVVAFRGTDPFSADGWSTDIDISYYEIANVGKLHRGFTKALGLIQKDNNMRTSAEQDQDELGTVRLYGYFEIVRALKKILKENPKASFIVTGHSLGGALAAMFAAALVINGEADLLARMAGLYAYAQPRIGDEEFAKYMDENMGKYNMRYKRYVYSFDIVPRIPADNKSFMYKHFGKCIFFDSRYNGKVVSEEPDKNFFSLVWLFPKLVTAIWELVRGFILPMKYGSDYKEGWFLVLFRLIGILFPGVSAHGPQDYVNSTRLGTISTRLITVPEDDSIKILIH